MSVSVILDNYENACFPGQTISGRLECNFDDEEKLRAIRIHFKGGAKVRWSESRGSGKSRRTVHYTSEDLYFDEAYNLLEGGEDFTLPAGRHVYPFAYILPAQLPSSCELAHGHVHYKIIGTVDRPWKFDHETEFMLNVVSPLDLNYMPMLREPRTLSADKEVGCCCFQSGPVSINVSLPITGFVAGQEINVGCYVQNLSNTSVTEVRYKINAVFEFTAHYPSTKSRVSYDEILKHVEGAIGAHGEKSWTAKFTIPQHAYVNLMSCKIINVSYMLEVEVVLPLPHTNLSVELPIMIGLIPLTGVSATVPGPPSVPQVLPPGYQMPPVLNPSAPYEGATANNDLPTYNEATNEKVPL